MRFDPDLELLGGRGAERVGRHQQHRPSFGFPGARHLADGGGLADTVDPDDEDDPRPLEETARRRHIELPSQLLPEDLPHRRSAAAGDLAAPGPQHLHRLTDGGQAEVRGEEGLFEGAQVRGIQGSAAANNVLDGHLENRTRSGEPSFQALKKAHKAAFSRSSVSAERWSACPTLADRVSATTR